MKYLRFQVRYSGKLGLPVGIFGACHHLMRAGRLSPEETELFLRVDGWFDEQLPHPPFYADGNSIRAITWFKPTATELIAALSPLRALLEKYEVVYDIVESEDPGIIVYEDAFQIGVVQR
jgi:hypothetical protein